MGLRQRTGSQQSYELAGIVQLTQDLRAPLSFTGQREIQLSQLTSYTLQVFVYYFLHIVPGSLPFTNSRRLLAAMLGAKCT